MSEGLTMHRATKLRPVGKGTFKRKSPHGRQITVWFPADLFDAIRAQALRERTAFAEQVRTYCEWGLDT